MISLTDIKKPIAGHIDRFEDYFRDTMKSKVPLLSVITNYILRTKGKQMRPILVFLSAKMYSEPQEGTYVAASLIELLHTASLIHDDVVDEAPERRGAFSIYTLWKTKVAVLVGDYLLAKGLMLSVEKDRFDILKIVSQAVKEMSEGELLQIEKARKLDINEEVYFEIIRQKTATLIAACTAAGARSVGADEHTVATMHSFGEKLGIAFQIKDDLFDYQPKGLIGKPVGNDIKEKKMTLPLIYALQKTDKKTKREVLRKINKYNNNKEKVAEIIQFVTESGGLEYARTRMEDYVQQALTTLDTLPETPARESMRMLVHYAIVRKK
ncbi:MAG: all-trans-octaprenyl-diphosphate synthase [Bacteroidota bacterium]